MTTLLQLGVYRKFNNAMKNSLQNSRQAVHFMLFCRFPVESLVSLPNGTVLSKLNANDLMESESSGLK